MKEIKKTKPNTGKTRKKDRRRHMTMFEAMKIFGRRSGIFKTTRTRTRVKDGRPILYGVNDQTKTFTRKSDAKALRNYLNGSCGGGSFHVTTIGK